MFFIYDEILFFILIYSLITGKRDLCMKKKRMKQSTLNYILGGTSIVLSITMIILSLLVYRAFEQMTVSVDRSAEFRQLGNTLNQASDYLTNEMRAYVQFGDRIHYDNYWREVNETKTREQVLDRLVELGSPKEEMALLEEANRESQTLVKTEEEAIKAVEEQRFDDARVLMFGDAYETAKVRIQTPIQQFLEKMNTRAKKELDTATANVLYSILAMVLFLIVTAITSVISLLVSHRNIIKPIMKIQTAMIHVADGEIE